MIFRLCTLHQQFKILIAGPRAYHGCATISGKIYVVGGFDGMDYFNSVRCFDPVNKLWIEAAPMNCRRFVSMIDLKLFQYEIDRLHCSLLLSNISLQIKMIRRQSYEAKVCPVPCLQLILIDFCVLNHLGCCN